MNKLEFTISEVLFELGVPSKLMGFEYLEEAIKLCYEDKSRLHHITKKLYPDIAQIKKTKSSRVERAIRFAIERAWDNMTYEKKKEFFGSLSKADHIKNSYFISEIIRVLKAREYHNDD